MRVSFLSHHKQRVITEFEKLKSKHTLACEIHISDEYKVQTTDGITFWCDATISLPELEGWTLIAVLDNVEGENVVRKIDTNMQVPNHLHNGSWCDYCQTQRFRNQTFLIHKEGVFRRVGSTCVDKFFGRSFQKALSDMVSFVSETESYGSDMSGAFYDRTLVLRKAVAATLLYGFLPSTHEDSTKNKVIASLHNMSAAYDVTLCAQTDSVVNEAAKLESFLLELTEESCTSDYMQNLRIASKTQSINPKHIGIVVSAVKVFQKKERKVIDNHVSEHVGIIGERKERLLTYVKHSEYLSVFGYTSFHSFVDEHGNIFVWKTTKQPDFEIGQSYRITGTLVEHSVFRGKNQNMINRCKT